MYTNFCLNLRFKSFNKKHILFKFKQFRKHLIQYKRYNIFFMKMERNDKCITHSELDFKPLILN